MALLLSSEQKQQLTTKQSDPESVFKIIEPLGEGAYGYVYSAIDTRNDIKIALKIMKIDIDLVVDLISEITIQKQCKSKYIVNFVDSFIKGSDIWLGIEYIDGGSCLDIAKITKTVWNEEYIAIILRETLKGLKYLHSKKLIHRDIKAANILLSTNGIIFIILYIVCVCVIIYYFDVYLGDVKLADFGVAKDLAQKEAGTTIGTPYWMAPEIFGNDHYTFSADIWSLGITAYEMSVGKPPLAGIPAFKAMMMIPKEDAPKLPEDQDWTSEFENFVEECCVKDPLKRATVDALLSDNKFILNGKDNEYLGKYVRECMPKIKEYRKQKLIESQKKDEESAINVCVFLYIFMFMDIY